MLYAFNSADHTVSQHAICTLHIQCLLEILSYHKLICHGGSQVLQCQGSMQTLGRRPGTRLVSGICISSRCACVLSLIRSRYVGDPGHEAGQEGGRGSRAGYMGSQVKSGCLSPPPPPPRPFLHLNAVFISPCDMESVLYVVHV